MQSRQKEQAVNCEVLFIALQNRPQGTHQILCEVKIPASEKHKGVKRPDAIIGDMSNTSQVVLPQIAQERLNRLKTRTAEIGVIGLGYVGLPLSLLLSEAGFKVTGFDIDGKKVNDLEAGRSYIFRIPQDARADSQDGGVIGVVELVDQAITANVVHRFP